MITDGYRGRTFLGNPFMRIIMDYSARGDCDLETFSVCTRPVTFIELMFDLIAVVSAAQETLLLLRSGFKFRYDVHFFFKLRL